LIIYHIVNDKLFEKRFECVKIDFLITLSLLPEKSVEMLTLLIILAVIATTGAFNPTSFITRNNNKVKNNLNNKIKHQLHRR